MASVLGASVSAACLCGLSVFAGKGGPHGPRQCFEFEATAATLFLTVTLFCSRCAQDEMTKDDWRLVIKLKKVFQIT